MLFGSDGLGIQFSDPNVAQFIGMLALSIILFSGGMDTKVAEVKPIASQGVVLATLGGVGYDLYHGRVYLLVIWFIWQICYVDFPGIFIAGGGHVLYGLSSVFSILRSKGVYLKERLRPTLELESGSNDPMAYMLTLLLIAYIQSGGMNIWGGRAILGHSIIGGSYRRFLIGETGCVDYQ